MSKKSIIRTICVIFLVSLTNPITIMADTLDEITLKDKSTYVNVSDDTLTPDTDSADLLYDSEGKLDQIITAYDQVKYEDDEEFRLGASVSGDGYLSYVSQDPNVVTVDYWGYVTIVGVGTTTITITASETDDYKSSTKAINITVKTGSRNISDGTYTYRINDDDRTVTLTGLVSSSKLIENPNIPSTVNGKSVTSIGSGAFSSYKGIVTGKLTLPNTLKTIDSDAFKECEYLTGELNIPNGVTDIGANAFNGCSGFSGSLIIPNSVTSIGGYVFEDCSGFTGSLTIGNSVTSIGRAAFEDCSDFTGSLTIPNSVTSIEDWAFYRCSGFTGSLTIGNSVTSIGEGAFYDCYGFTGSLTIPNSVTSIGESAFYDCYGFTGSLTIPNSVTYIGDGAFACDSITKVINNTIQPCKAWWFIEWDSDDYFISDTGEKITRDGVLRKGTFTKHVGVTNVTLNESYVTIKTGKTVTLTATIEPSTATNKKVSWKSSNKKIATVSKEGVVKGMAGGTATITATTEDGEKTASCEVTVEGPKPSIKNAKVKLSQTSYTYDKKKHIPGIISIGGKELREGSDYTTVIVNTNGKTTASPKSAGTYIIVITGTGDYTGSTSAKFVINKAKNPIKVTGKTVTIKYSKLKKKPQTIKRSKIISVSKNQGKITYKKTKGNAKISIDEKSGNLTVKKGLKKGSYTIKVKVSAAGGKNYKAAVKTIRFRVKVK